MMKNKKLQFLKTRTEIIKAIEKLNTGKSADENGIQAEHFRNAKEEVASFIREIINRS